MICKTLIALVLAMISFSALSETNLYAGAWSFHGDDPEIYDYNETHNLLALERDRWIAGYFKNSIRRDTFFAGMTISKTYGNFEAGLIVGAMHGYSRCFGKQMLNERDKLCPMVVPTVSYTDHWIEPTAYLMGNALAVGVRFEL